jgi:hypothetical protein
MNTNDIRNMDQNQWLYWAVALPVTVIVVLLCLVLAGVLQVASSPGDEDWEGDPTALDSAPAHKKYWREDDVTRPLELTRMTRPDRPLNSYKVDGSDSTGIDV